MDPSPADGAGVLCREILADAGAQAREIVETARRDAEALQADGATRAQAERSRRLDQARDEAARRSEAIEATIAVEAARIRSARIDALLRSLCEEARGALRAGTGFDASVARAVLAAIAVARMEGDAFVLRCPAGHPVDPGEVRRRVGRASLRLAVRPDPSVADGGVIVEDEEARQVWDNRLEARLDRLWPDLRRELVSRVAGGS